MHMADLDRPSRIQWPRSISVPTSPTATPHLRKTPRPVAPSSIPQSPPPPWFAHSTIPQSPPPSMARPPPAVASLQSPPPPPAAASPSSEPPPPPAAASPSSEPPPPPASPLPSSENPTAALALSPPACCAVVAHKPFRRRDGSSSIRRSPSDMRDGNPLLPPLTLCNRGEVPATWPFRRDQPGGPSWAELPVDMVCEVMSRLPTHDDRLRFIAVCQEWCASGREYWRPPQPSVAYLLLPIGTFFWFPEFRASRRLDDDCVNYCSAACDDWLLLEGDGSGRLRLMSPFTGRTRRLPALSSIRVDDEPIEELPQWRDADKMTVWKLVVCPNGLIAAIIGREHFAKVALCSLKSKTWKLNGHDRWRWYEDMAFSDGKLYALTNRDDLLAFDVGRDASSGEPAVSRIERVIKGSDGGGDRGGDHGIVKMRYLVRSCRGALLKVQRVIQLLPNTTTVLFTVFEADLRSSPRQWVEAKDLGGDEALFVGRLCSRAVPVSDAVWGNKIYFPTDDWAGMSFWTKHLGQPSHHAAVYDMREKTVSYLVPRQIWTDGWAPVTWLFPDTTEY